MRAEDETPTRKEDLLKLEKAKHAPGTVFLLERNGEIHEAVIVGWSPMGQAVKIMAGQAQMWIATPKAHVIEFLRIVGWDEFKQMMDEAEEARKKAEEAKVQESAKEAS